MENKGGYIKLYRKTIQSNIWYKPSEWFKIWLYLVLSVNYEPNGLPVGSGYFTYRNISDDCGVTYGQVDKFIRWAKEDKMLTTKQTPRGMIVCIIKYPEYQGGAYTQYLTKSVDDQSTQKTTQKPILEEDYNESESTLQSESSRGPVEPIYNKKERIKNIYPEEFEKFYLSYPKHEDKKPAYGKFKIKVKQDGLEKIMQGLTNWKNKWEEENTLIRYIPSPEVWLNREKYNDEFREDEKKEEKTDALERARKLLANNS